MRHSHHPYVVATSITPAKRFDEYSKPLDWGLRLTLLLAAPAALALAIIAVPLITTLFHHGAFTTHDVFMTRNALVAYSLGLLGLILVKVLAPGLRLTKTCTPVKIGLFTLCVTQALNLALIGWLQHAGLALSIGLAACLNALLLYRGLRRHASTHHNRAGCCSAPDWQSP